MQDLNTISSSQYANEQATAINQNFSALKSAVESIGGGSGGGSAELVRTYANNLPGGWRYAQYGTTTKMKVLVMGNSFSFFPTSAFANIITLSGTTKSYCLECVGVSGGSGNTLSLSLERIVYDNTGYFTHKIYGTGGIEESVNGNMVAKYRSVLINDWDAIVFHQRSTDDDDADYSTYFPYLNALVDAAKTYCTNDNVKIGWQMVWDKYHGKENSKRAAILLNSKRVMDDCGIDFIVPTGTAIENAWANNLPIDYQLTGWPKGLDTAGHVKGILQYVASAVWYQTLYSAFFGKDVVNDIIPSSNQTWTDIKPDTTTATAANCILAAKCAKAAVEDMWNITTNIS